MQFLPARLGPQRSLWIARFSHLLALAGFTAFAVAAGGGWIRLMAVAAATVLMLWQHHLVRADDLSAVDAAFFTANGLLSVVMCSLFLIAKLIESP